MKSARILLILILITGLAGVAAAGRLAFAAPPPVPSLNGDTLSDLVIGVPNEAYISRAINEPQAGAVNVIYSAAGGLAGSGSQLWNQGGPAVEGNPETEDHFGTSVTSGDFNGDGYADLAVGNPDEDVNIWTDAGTVNILYGSASGVTTTNQRDFHQNRTGVEGGPANGEGFGTSLASGDFNGDGYDDLAIGVPGNTSDDIPGSAVMASVGAVNVIYGSSAGLDPAAVPDQIWYQGGGLLNGTPEEGDRFGAALAVGDFNGDGVDDLAVGVPGDTAGVVASAGAVQVIFGSDPGGLTASGNQLLNLETADVPGDAAVDDRFGASLAAGDFNGDGIHDLAVGIPGYDPGGVNDSGAVSVFLGGAGGLQTSGSQLWDQGAAGVNTNPEAGEQFGFSLAAGDFNWDGYSDLAVGAPFEHIGAIAGGAVTIIHGSASGLDTSANPAQFWHQGDAASGLEGEVGDGDGFGYSLAAGDFNDDGYGDLAVGIPFEEVNGLQDAGAVSVIYGTLGGLSATGNQLWHQDSPDIVGEAAADEHFGFSLAASGIRIQDVPSTPPTTQPPPGGAGGELFLPLLNKAP